MVKLKGQITVLASLTLMLVLSLVFACFKSSGDSSYNTIIKQACELSNEAVFAGYCNDMLNEYSILLLKKSDKNNKELSSYIADNISAYSNNISLVKAEYDNCVYVTDNGGAGIRDEILKYMQYGVYSEIVNSFRESEQQVNKSKKINEISDDIAQCEESIYEMDKSVLELIMSVEGIKTTEAGIVTEGGKPVRSGDDYVKALVRGNVSMSSVNINNEKVYNVMKDSGMYVDMDQCLTDMNQCLEGLYNEGDEVSESRGSSSYDAIYERNLNKLKKAYFGACKNIDNALSTIEQYKRINKEASLSLERCKNKVEESKDIIGEEIYSGLKQDLCDIEKDGLSDSRKMCDINAMEKCLREDKQVLDSASSYINNMDVKITASNSMEIKKYVKQAEYILTAYTNNGLKFDYSAVDFSSKSKGMDAIRKLYETMSDGLVGLVIDEGNISDKTIKYSDLASGLGGDSSSSGNLVKATIDTALYDEYILSHFNNFMDYTGTNKTLNDNALLKYMVEYVLCGKDSDKDNLKQVMIELSAIREGMNFAYLLTDSGKKTEAYSLAATLLGFTGNTAVIKAGQYLILAAWAYGESILELRELYKGKKIEFVKTKNNWRLSLGNLLVMNLDGDEKNDGKTGMDYKDYLRVLLLTENGVKKNYRVMGAMELRMMELGHSDFRMREYIISASGTAVFKNKGKGNLYSQQIYYSYV